MKIMLIEKYERNKITKYYVERCSDLLEVIDEIICGTVPNIFSYDDQYGPELLSNGKIEEYVNHMCSLYESDTTEYHALKEVKDTLVAIYNCETIETLKELLRDFNETMSKYEYDISLILVYDYDEKFFSTEEKYEFRDALYDAVRSRKVVNENTYILWHHEKNSYIEEGKWCWSNSLKDLIDYFKYVVMDNILTTWYYFNPNYEIKDHYSLSESFDEVIEKKIEKESEITFKIKELVYSLDYSSDFETFENVLEEVCKNFKLIGIDCSLNLFKGVKYPKMILEARNVKYDDNNIVEALMQDYIC